MQTLIDVLPGLPMPVNQVTDMLARMWDTDPGDGSRPPSDFRASQLNLILHFGLATSAEEALDKFQSAIDFARRYPCRIVVLCPTRPGDSAALLEGKLFSQCYIGPQQRDLCCCEALILGYSIEEANFLDDQVSLWLESDLPIYHWLNRVPAARIRDCYLPFIRRCRRVLIDTSVPGDEALVEVPWPASVRVADLASARNLPWRQHIGQFLSSFPVAELASGLQSIEFCATPAHLAQTRQLMTWHRRCLDGCRSHLKSFVPASVTLNLQTAPTDAAECLTIRWLFTDNRRHIAWRFNLETHSGSVCSQLAGHPTEHHFHIEPLSPAAALAEGLFFQA
jgi:hypothetical protein